MCKFKILITAGPTREYIDPVRYISNDSSGQMGFALASAAKKMGARVTLVSGPTSLLTPVGVRRIDVITAKEMFTEVKKHAKRADIIIMAAAVADFRPKQFSNRKIKKKDVKTAIQLKLVPNPDILATLGKIKRPNQFLIGFALETNNLKQNALKKLREKNCDLIVANTHKNIGSKKAEAILFSSSGKQIRIPMTDKIKLAKMILKAVVRR